MTALAILALTVTPAGPTWQEIAVQIRGANAAARVPVVLAPPHVVTPETPPAVVRQVYAAPFRPPPQTTPACPGGVCPQPQPVRRGWFR